MTENKIKVLYVGGFGRSGSTLIDIMLGKIPAFFSAGELYWIWKRSFQENQLCGDGNPFHDSPFWRQVVQEAYGGFDGVDAIRMDELRTRVARLRYAMKMRSPDQFTGEFKQDFSEFAGNLLKLYRAIQQVSGCEIIVDSSKYPPYGFLLNAMPELDVSMLHLVRDSRAVAHSWQRKKVRPEIHWTKEYMPQFSPTRSSYNWMSNNYLCGRFQSASPKYLFKRYEDFVQDPEGHFKEILKFIGKGDTPTDFLKGNSFEPSPMQNVSGNPMRFEKKDIVIRPDAEWRTQMPRNQQLLVTAMTFPLLFAYGYLGQG